MNTENLRKLNNGIQELLTEYDHYNSPRGVKEIIDEWLCNKGPLMEMLSKHPNWDAENFRIVFNTDYNRPMDMNGIYDFVSWTRRTARKNEMDTHSDEYNALYGFGTMLKEIESNVIDEDFAKEFAALFPDIPCATGTRIMKVVRRVLQKYNLDKIVDMQTTTWTDDNGVEHSREKDMGSNYWIAYLGDSINPLKITRHTIISLNPLDYLTMSFGNGWASCHTIDKENKRRNRNTYEGQYCSGTLSYMLDKVSVIFYTVNADYDGNEYETQDKINRVMFHINEDYTAMIEGRVYPDGRDGGDNSLAAQFRNVMQKVLSDCTKENNLWVLKKGCSEISGYVRSEGTHYRDYSHYDDCNISIRKGTENPKMIYVGHSPICPKCGAEHDIEGELNCEECKPSYDDYCERCGDGIPEGEGIWCEDNERMYCCWDCANNDDVYYCEDDGRWHTENNCYRDDYSGDYYYEYEVYTEDGNYYGTTENAEADGYRCANNGCWYPEDDLLYDENKDEYFIEDEDTVEINGKYFMNEESACEAGYIFFEDEWYEEEDCVTDDFTGEMFPRGIYGSVRIYDGEFDYFYRSEKNATEDGWVKAEDDKWVRAEKKEEVA